MMLVLTIILGSWLLVALGVGILCKATQRLDDEIDQAESEAGLPEFRLPFAS